MEWVVDPDKFNSIIESRVMTYREVAIAAEMSPLTIRRMALGMPVRVHTVRIVAASLGVSATDFAHAV